MVRKTIINAEEGRQEIFITREFDLPVELLFKAHVEPEFLSQWMGTRVVKLESQPHGGWRFETSDGKGNVLFSANGVIHQIIANQKIIRTFEMDNVPSEVQLEFMDFERLTDEKSKLTIHTIFRSVAIRDRLLAQPFAYGINMAHDRLEEVIGKLA